MNMTQNAGKNRLGLSVVPICGNASKVSFAFD